MGKMEIEAAEEFVSVLDRLVKNSDGIAKKAVYKGAGTAADEIKKEIESLPASGIAIQGKKDQRKKIPVVLTARAIISGTSFRHKNDFVRRAVSRAKEKTVETMNNVIEEEIKKEME